MLAWPARAKATLLPKTTLRAKALPRVLATRLATFPPHSRFTSASTRCEPRCTVLVYIQPWLMYSRP